MEEKELKVSIVICAYNEEKTIESVVHACRQFNPESEILVLDDGSQDKTPEILKQLAIDLGIRNIRLAQNKGKSWAMARGVEEAENEIILFWDADVTGIREEHFTQILKPIYEGEADMVLGQPSETFMDHRYNPFRGLTGERAILKKELMPILDEFREIAFGVETYINLYFRAHGKKIVFTLLEGLNHPTKYKKTSLIKATTEFLSEGQEIAQTYIDNYDLITKRIELSFDEQNTALKERLRRLQNEINTRFRVFMKGSDQDNNSGN